MMNLENLWSYKEKLHSTHNLIHCITNPISMNDCANAVLALGAKPIMAQHPKEVAQITSTSQALALNLGNLDDIRCEAMCISATQAKQNHIPIILDLVGVGCSQIRLQFATKMIEENHPDVLKGNLSEIKAIAGRNAHAIGIDVGDQDLESVQQSCQWISTLAKKLNCIILCTGKSDIISDGIQTYVIENGCEMMTLCTGTGCMLNVICATMMSCGNLLQAVVFATSYFGIVAQKCYEQTKLPGSFHYQLFDWLYALTKEDYMTYKKIKEVQI